MARAPDDNRGRTATRPSDVPKAGWFDILSRMWERISTDNIDTFASAVAFSEFFALFPAMAAGIALYGLLADPSTVDASVAGLAGVLPPGMDQIIGDQMRQLAAASPRGLGLSLIIALAVALWGAAAGVRSLIIGLNVVYAETEKRGFIKRQAVALVLTLSAIVFGLVALALVAALPAVLNKLPLGEFGRLLATVVRWPILAGFVLIALAVVYRFAPSREAPQWRWVSWGATIAAILWLAGSALFSIYVTNFGKMNQTYGSFAAVAVMLLWFELTGFVVLLGALIDAELEHQTAYDTTSGQPEPMGRRGANVADTLGRERGQRD